MLSTSVLPSLKKRKGKRFRDAERDLVVRRRASCISLKQRDLGLLVLASSRERFGAERLASMGGGDSSLKKSKAVRQHG